jgi:hypothetical protein
MKSYKQWVDEYLQREYEETPNKKPFAWAKPDEAKALADVGKALAKVHHARKFWKNSQ